MDIYVNASKKQHFLEKVARLSCEAASNHSVFSREKAKSLSAHVKYINNLLNNNAKRKIGLQYLLVLIMQCNDTLLKEEGERWFKLCMKACNPQKTALYNTIISTILKTILRRSEGLHELRGRLAKLDPAFIEVFLQAGEQWRKPAFDCIGEYLRQFPGPSLYFKNKIEATVLKALNEPIDEDINGGNVAGCAKLYALLPPSGTGKGNPSFKSEAKGLQLRNLIALSHAIMDRLLNGIVERKMYEHTREHPFAVQILAETSQYKDSFKTIISLTSTLINTFSFIANLILGAPGNAIVLSPKSLMESLSRILQVDLRSLLSAHGQEFRIVAQYMPSIQQRALQLFDLLLQSLDTFDLFYGELQDLFTSVICNCNPNHREASLGNQTKIFAYRALATLIQISSGRHSVTKHLVDTLILDILPEKDCLSLRATASLANVKLRKKKNKKGGYTVEETVQNEIDGDSFSSQKEEVTAAALKVIRVIFLYGHHTIPLELLKALQRSLMEIALVPNETLLSSLTSYKDPATRECLYEAIIALSMYPHPSSPPPYPGIIDALSLGIKDANREVCTICQSGLSTLSFITANPQVNIFFDTINERSTANDTDTKGEKNISREYPNFNMGGNLSFPPLEDESCDEAEGESVTMPDGTPYLDGTVQNGNFVSSDSVAAETADDSNYNSQIVESLISPLNDSSRPSNTAEPSKNKNLNKRNRGASNEVSSKKRKTTGKNKKNAETCVEDKLPSLSQSAIIKEESKNSEVNDIKQDELMNPSEEADYLKKVFASFNDGDPDSE